MRASRSVAVVTSAIIILLTVQACSGASDPVAEDRYLPSGRNDRPLSMEGGFNAYVIRAKAMIYRARVFDDPEQRHEEVDFNAPFEIRPNGAKCSNQPNRGILMVHGLSDSPAVWRDLSAQLVDNCYLVRTILLPGHGTRPGDLMNVTHLDWLQSARQAVRQMSDEVDQLYVAGFSMGATIAAILAYEGEPINGLVLLSPAFRTFSRLQFMITWLEPFMNWLHREPGEMPGRYSTMSVNGAAEFHRLSSRLFSLGRRDLELTIPVYMALSSDDSLIDVPFAVRAFNEFLTSPHNRMLIVGGPDDTAKLAVGRRNSKIISLNSSMPDQGILKFSHIAMPYSPGNPAYGRNGVRSCGDYAEASKDHEACRTATEIIYTNVRGEEDSPNHFKLTFNPYFDVMSRQIIDFLARADQGNTIPRRRLMSDSQPKWRNFF